MEARIKGMGELVPEAGYYSPEKLLSTKARPEFLKSMMLVGAEIISDKHCGDNEVGVRFEGLTFIYDIEVREVRDAVTGFRVPPMQRDYIEWIVKELGFLEVQ